MGGQPSGPQGGATQGGICGALLPSHGRWGEGSAQTWGGRRLGPSNVGGNWDIRWVGTGPPVQRQPNQPPQHHSLSTILLCLFVLWMRNRGEANVVMPLVSGRDPPGLPGGCPKAKAPPRAPLSQGQMTITFPQVSLQRLLGTGPSISIRSSSSVQGLQTLLPIPFPTRSPCWVDGQEPA